MNVLRNILRKRSLCKSMAKRNKRQFKENFSSFLFEKIIVNEAVNMNGDIIYVTDMDTNEIVYVNEVAKMLFGTDILGKKCYDVFQSFDRECKFCNNNTLRANPNKPDEWVFFNQQIGQLLFIIDVMKLVRDPNGKIWRLRYERATNITAQLGSIKTLDKKYIHGKE